MNCDSKMSHFDGFRQGSGSTHWICCLVQQIGELLLLVSSHMWLCTALCATRVYNVLYKMCCYVLYSIYFLKDIMGDDHETIVNRVPKRGSPEIHESQFYILFISISN